MRFFFGNLLAVIGLFGAIGSFDWLVFFKPTGAETVLPTASAIASTVPLVAGLVLVLLVVREAAGKGTGGIPKRKLR